MKKLLTAIGAAIGFAATLNATEINLRDWLTAKGVTVANCVSGKGHISDYVPQKLFDGVGMGGVYNSSYRWIAGDPNLSGVYVTIEIPKSAISAAKKELVLKRFRLWRSMNSGSNTGLQRAPLTWIVSGSNDGVGWTVLHNQSTAVTWQNKTYNEVALAENTEPFRYIKFEPKTSNYAYTPKTALQEIEYFVEEVPQKPGVNLRDWLTEKGAVVADCVSGEGHNSSYGPTILFDGTNSVSNATDAKNNRWLAQEKASDSANVVIAAPDTLFGNDADGLVLRRYRIYRYSELSDEHYFRRAPATWKILGWNDEKEDWDVIDDRTSEPAEWYEPGVAGAKSYLEFEVPDSGRTPYRKFKFQPAKSFIETYNAGNNLGWKLGAMELEYFVEESQAANLRTYLAAKGVTVAECVSGTGYHNSYKPEKLFDGDIVTGSPAGNMPERWLAGEKDCASASATFEIPALALPSGKKGLAVKKIRLWRNRNNYNTKDGVSRAPKTWVFYGSNTGLNGDWAEIHRQSEPVVWSDNIWSLDVLLPDNDKPFRFIKFHPLSSNYGGDYRVGLQELEYFVAEVPLDTVVVRGSLGDDVGDSSHGYGRVNGVIAGDTLTITAKTPSYANGVKYEATGYTLETSVDGGITWGAATSHNGTSATIAYDGTPTRLTWQWSPIAYRLDAHADEGNETVTVSPASADGYYAAGTALTVTAAGATSPTVTTFKEWDVLPDGATANGATVNFTMPAAPTEVNASFTRPWTYLAPGGLTADYPAYNDLAAVTDGNWLFVVASRPANNVSAEQYFCMDAYVEGSGRLDLTTLYSDLETEDKRLYPLRGVNASAMHKAQDYYDNWHDGRGKITSVVVSVDILDVEGAAFGGCPNLVSATLEGNLENWNILNSDTAAGAFNDCPALASVKISGATALPHHIFSGSAPEVFFDGVPPATVGTGWAEDWSIAVGCLRKDTGEWRVDSRFTAIDDIADVDSKPNYAAMFERYGKDLIGAWNDKWLFRYGTPPGMLIIIR